MAGIILFSKLFIVGHPAPSSIFIDTTSNDAIPIIPFDNYERSISPSDSDSSYGLLSEEFVRGPTSEEEDTGCFGRKGGAPKGMFSMHWWRELFGLPKKQNPNKDAIPLPCWKRDEPDVKGKRVKMVEMKEIPPPLGLRRDDTYEDIDLNSSSEEELGTPPKPSFFQQLFNERQPLPRVQLRDVDI